MLTCTLRAKEAYTAGEDVEITFLLTNETGQRLAVLNWQTPLEGDLTADRFEIRQGDRRVAYQGMLVKRGPPARKDYVEIGPHGLCSVTFNLAKDYRLTEPGEYRVMFSGKLFDVAPGGGPLPQPGHHRPLELLSNTLVFEVRKP